MDDGDVHRGWSATEAEVNGVLASAERLLPGMRGRAAVGDETLAVVVSVGTPLLPVGVWANLEVAFADSDDGLEIAAARIGRLPLPPALAERALRIGLDRALGPGAGDAAVASVAALALSPGKARVAFNADDDGRVPLLEFLRVRARGAAGTDARALAEAQIEAIQAAVRTGRLPRQGSFLPYVRFVVDTAGRQAGPDRERARGALYALALYCGDPGFETVVGVSLPGRSQGKRNGCLGTTLGGRDDLRQHFAISAGLDAATSGTAAIGIGELKELLDSNPGGSGFSFEDMAADVAGVRFSRTFLAAPPDGLARARRPDRRRGRGAALARRPAERPLRRRVRTPATAASTARPTPRSSPRSTAASRRCRCTVRRGSRLSRQASRSASQSCMRAISSGLPRRRIEPRDSH